MRACACVRACMRACVRVCVCVCACARERESLHLCVWLSVWLSVCRCVSLCVLGGGGDSKDTSISLSAHVACADVVFHCKVPRAVGWALLKCRRPLLPLRGREMVSRYRWCY